MIRSLSYCTSDVGPRPYTPYGSVSIDAALGSAASAPSAATSSKRQTKTCAGGAGNRSWTPETIAASMRGEVGLAHRWLGSDRQDEKEIGKRFLRRAELDPKEHVPPEFLRKAAGQSGRAGISPSSADHRYQRDRAGPGADQKDFPMFPDHTEWPLSAPRSSISSWVWATRCAPSRAIAVAIVRTPPSIGRWRPAEPPRRPETAASSTF